MLCVHQFLVYKNDVRLSDLRIADRGTWDTQSGSDGEVFGWRSNAKLKEY